MASDNFASANNPLASPWTSFGGSFAGMKSASGVCSNAAGSDGDAGAYYSSSSATESSIDYISGTTDGGPAVHMGTGPDGYVNTAYNGTEVFAFRLDDGSYSSELGHATGVYVTTQTIRIRRSGSNLITSLAGVDTLTVTDATYTGGSPGIFGYAGNFTVDNWTDGASGGAFSLAIDSISYTLSLQTVGLRATRRVATDSIIYSLSLQSVGLTHAAKLSIGSIAYTLSLQDVTLTGPSAEFSLAIDSISYSLTLGAALADYVMSVQPISYALTLQDVSLEAGRKTVAESISYALTLQDVAMSRTRLLKADPIAYALSLQDIATPVVHAYRLVCEALSYALDLSQLALRYSGQDEPYIITRPFDPFGWYRP